MSTATKVTTPATIPTSFALVYNPSDFRIRRLTKTALSEQELQGDVDFNQKLDDELNNDAYESLPLVSRWELGLADVDVRVADLRNLAAVIGDVGCGAGILANIGCGGRWG
jgi:hypothetical protein